MAEFLVGIGALTEEQISKVEDGFDVEFTRPPGAAPAWPRAIPYVLASAEDESAARRQVANRAGVNPDVLFVTRLSLRPASSRR